MLRESCGRRAYFYQSGYYLRYPGVAVSRVVTIAAAGGGGWFRVTTPKDTATGQQRAEDMGDKWINFNQLIEVREALVKKGGK